MVGKYKVITLCGSTRFKNELTELRVMFADMLQNMNTSRKVAMTAAFCFFMKLCNLPLVICG